jgi:hypothetical protein
MISDATNWQRRTSVITTPENFQPHRVVFNRSFVIILIVAATTLAIYVWALMHNLSEFLGWLGLASFAALLFLPVVIAYLTARTTIGAVKTSTKVLSMNDYTALSMRRCAPLLTMDALIAIPVVVLFNFYFQMYFAAVFSRITCSYGPCNVSPQFTIPDTLWQQTTLGFVAAMGLWGLNLLAIVVASRLALHWRHTVGATAGTVVLLVVTVAAMIFLPLWTDTQQPILVVIAALLPYVLALLLLPVSQRSTSQRAIAATRE